MQPSIYHNQCFSSFACLFSSHSRLLVNQFFSFLAFGGGIASISRASFLWPFIEFVTIYWVNEFLVHHCKTYETQHTFRGTAISYLLETLNKWSTMALCKLLNPHLLQNMIFDQQPFSFVLAILPTLCGTTEICIHAVGWITQNNEANLFHSTPVFFGNM